jgi:elongation factor 1-beta
MAKFDDVKDLNAFLEDNAFVDGFVPTKADAEMFATLKECPTLPHAARWWRNIQSYSEEERRAWSAAEKKEAAAAAAGDDDDDDFDLFETTEEDEKVLEEERQRKADELAAKAKATGAARSQIVLDVKPWDDSTPMDKLEAGVRAVAIDGLAWGQSKLVAVGFGIKKLQIVAVVIDDLVSTDDLEEQIVAIDDYVQSMDVVSFNKL